MSTNLVFFQLVTSHYKYVSLSYNINDMASMLLEHLLFSSNHNWRVEKHSVSKEINLNAHYFFHFSCNTLLGISMKKTRQTLLDC